MSKEKIFKSGSTTYYYSSLFFPENVKDHVFNLYAFVRTADNFVDAIPQKINNFNQFRELTKKTFAGKETSNTIIQSFYETAKQYDIEYNLVEAFFDAMEADTKKSIYKTYTELEKYMYGSAEVIGLMMAKLLKLPEKSYSSARLQGRAMQLINFIRDVSEDTDMGRTYIPAEDIKKFGLQKLPVSSDMSGSDLEKFTALMRFEIERYFVLQKQAEEGYSYIPPRYLIPIKTAAQLYNWTAREIYKNPSIVFQKKVKPKPLRVILNVLWSYITL